MTTHHDPRNCDCTAHGSHSFLALADMQLRAEKAEQKRDERDAAAHAWKETSREMFRQRQDARTELARFQLLAAGWITEAQSEATEAVTRAESAELRAEKAEQERAAAVRELANVRMELRVERSRAEQPRPLTAADIDDEMVERAVAAYNASAAGTRAGHMREVLAAALTPPPKRPEGAEEWEEVLGSWERSELLGQNLTADDLNSLADHLAERGVHVTGGEDA